MDAKKAFGLIKSGEVLFVDLRFTDLRGVWQHYTIAARDFNEENGERGYGFDGSSIRGFQEIYESDLLMKPDFSTVFLDPFHEKTLVCICDIYDPISGKEFEKDPRRVARRAEEYLKKTGIGDVSYWGPEAEFFLFDRMSVTLSPMYSGVDIRSNELEQDDYDMADGYTIRPKSGYFPCPPFDKLQDFRSEMVTILESIGVEIEVHHHEVAAPGQVEIDMRYDTLVSMADKLMKYKYVARNLAKRYGLTACFLPKPIYGDNGTGMHVHQSIFKKGKNVFFDPKGYAELSKDALSYAAGLLSNIEAVLGITNSTVNSYRRLVPHFEAPTAVAFSKRNRSAAIRIPMYTKGEEKAKRLEFRCPDPTTNPYLAFAAQLVFGLEGVKKKMDPTKLAFGPYDENIWEKEGIKQTPGDLYTTLSALKKDTLLAKSGVFPQSLIDSFYTVKFEEARQSMLYPTAADFYFYGDI